MNPADFRKRLIGWYEQARRDLPWRRAPHDPYRIWISEIMLQQTRVAAVIPYYERFLSRFPTIAALAAAPEQDVLAHWAGLGYYSRARNLHRAAREIGTDDAFPATYEGIRALPGVGDYTAAAIASISFGLPYAVVDGNVLRVLTRLTNDASDIAAPKTRTKLTGLAQSLLDVKRPADFNQAIMELGATVCTPKSPSCLLCPVQQVCEGLRAGTHTQLPVKLRNAERREVHETLWRIEHRGRILLRQRASSEAKLADFWELPTQIEGVGHGDLAGEFQHQITVTRYYYRVLNAKWPGGKTPPGLHWVKLSDLPSLPLTTAARKALALPVTAA